MMKMNNSPQKQRQGEQLIHWRYTKSSTQ